jgi:hypothetical protein
MSTSASSAMVAAPWRRSCVPDRRQAGRGDQVVEVPGDLGRVPLVAAGWSSSPPARPCGAAVSLPMLVAGRAVQDAFAAILIPTALSLLTMTFTEPNQRARTFAVCGAIGISGGARELAAHRSTRSFHDRGHDNADPHRPPRVRYAPHRTS